MRIGFDARSLLEAQPSGVSVYTEELLSVLLPLVTSKGHTLCIYSSGRAVPKERIARLIHGQSNVEWRHVGQPNKWLRLFGLPIDHVLGGIDVLFIPNWNSVRLSKHIPVVLTVHDLAYKLYPQALSWKRKLWHIWVQPERLMRRAKQLIAVSKITQQALLPLTSTVIPSAAPTAVAPKALALPSKYVLMVATLEPRKNLITAVQAMHQLWQQGSDLKLVVMGPSGWNNKKMQQWLNHPNVHYIGYVTPAEKWFALQHAAALLYPSLYEGFGFPPLEAFQVGIPVVTSVHGASPEVCGEAAIYVNPYSVTDIAQAITAVMAEPLRSTLITRGKQQLMHFSWEQTAQRTLQVIEESVY